jgi:hypothetical protein
MSPSMVYQSGGFHTLVSTASEGTVRHALNAQTLASGLAMATHGDVAKGLVSYRDCSTGRLERSFSPPLVFKATTAVL